MVKQSVGKEMILDKVNGFLNFLQKEAKSGYEFGKEVGKKEIPGILREVVLLGRISTTLIAVASLLMGIVLIGIPVLLGFLVPTKYIIYLFLLFVPYVLAVYFYVKTFTEAKSWFERFSSAWFTPRLYILSQVKKIIKD